MTLSRSVLGGSTCISSINSRQCSDKYEIVIVLPRLTSTHAAAEECIPAKDSGPGLLLHNVQATREATIK